MLSLSLFIPTGGHKMYHPTNYVLVTDLDDMEQLEYAELHKAQGGGSGVGSSSINGVSSGESAVLASLSSPAAIGAATPTSQSLPQSRPTPTATPASAAALAKETAAATAAAQRNGKAAAATQAVSALERLTFQPYYDQRPTSGFTFNTNNTHIPATAAIEMPERAWQDCIMNTLHVDAAAAEATCKATSAQQHDEEREESKQDSKQLVQQQIQQQQQQREQQQRQKLWNFVDPMQKAPCICTK